MFTDNTYQYIKIIDFGTSICYSPDNIYEKKIGTPIYVAPEVLKGKYNELCDIWSLGVTFFYMMTLKKPFEK